MVHKAQFSLPLVSIIITNYNYGRFLIEAVASAKAQSYPDIECVIVDDASTDESGEVLKDVSSRWPDVKIIRKEKNAGQTAAFNTGLAATSGQYVVFLDADDVLLPKFVETHIFVHISSRVPAGFTSSDMFQSLDSRLVTGTYSLFSAYTASQKGMDNCLLRHIDKTDPQVWPTGMFINLDLENNVHLVKNIKWDQWLYAPTSGNCYRRDALNLFLKCDSLDLKIQADTYLNKGICLVSGAILIDMPLSIYRIHGGNGLVSHPELSGVFFNDMKKCFRGEIAVFRAVVDRLTDDDGLFFQKMGFTRYKEALVRMQRGHIIEPDFEEFGALSNYIESRLLLKADKIKSMMGAHHFNNLLDSVRMASSVSHAAKGFILRPVAELLLTLARLTGSKKIWSIGDRVWHL